MAERRELPHRRSKRHAPGNLPGICRAKEVHRKEEGPTGPANGRAGTPPDTEKPRRPWSRRSLWASVDYAAAPLVCRIKGPRPPPKKAVVQAPEIYPL